MKKLIWLILLWPGLALATPLEMSSGVQRVTPQRCPVDIIPTVNALGASGAPVPVTTATKVIQGKGTRVVYSFISDGDFCAEYGSVSDAAPATAPSGGTPCVAGILYKANVPYIENVYPANRMDAACVTGTCNIYTEECVP